jgi:hypothetical protein
MAANSQWTSRPFQACGGWLDMRDLGAVLDHEGPLPHAAEDQAQ